MKILVGDIDCTVIHPKENPKAISIIRTVCAARPEGYRFMSRFRQGVWDGYIRLCTLSTFPTGLLHLVIPALNAVQYPFELEYAEPIKTVPYAPYVLNGIELRDYQINAIECLLMAHRGIAKMAPNSGKTEIMAAIIKALDFPKTMVFVHRKELLNQTAARFTERLGIDVGKMGDGLDASNLRNVSVVMIQTASRQIDYMDVEGTKLVMVDECHHSSSDSYMDILAHIPGSYRFGFSGTPLDHGILQDLKLIAMTGPVVVEVSNHELIEAGHSAKPSVRIAKLPVYNAYKTDSYQEAYDALIVANDERNEMIKKYARGINGTVLILVERLEHGIALQELTGGIFVTGKHSTDDRQKAIDTMRSGVGGIFIATPIFDEGVDVPGVDCIILAGGGKSQTKLIQRIGRGLRKKVGSDNTLIVYDFIDSSNKYLKAHSKKRLEIYKNEQFAIEYI